MKGEQRTETLYRVLVARCWLGRNFHIGICLWWLKVRFGCRLSLVAW